MPAKRSSRIRSRRGRRIATASRLVVAAERMGCPLVPFPPPTPTNDVDERCQANVHPKTQPRPGPGKRAEAFGWRLIVVTPWEPATTTSAGHHPAGHRGGYLPYPRDVGSSDDVDGVVSTTTSRSTNTPPTRVRDCSADSATLRANPAAFDLNRDESCGPEGKPPRSGHRAPEHHRPEPGKADSGRLKRRKDSLDPLVASALAGGPHPVCPR